MLINIIICLIFFYCNLSFIIYCHLFCKETKQNFIKGDVSSTYQSFAFIYLYLYLFIYLFIAYFTYLQYSCLFCIHVNTVHERKVEVFGISRV